ncbi:hypothetical protein ACFIOY_34685 [Bradyrhizobium sp. TZ2]
MIRQAQRHEECVRHRPRAENGGKHDVACESGQPRKKRKTADSEDASEHAPLLSYATALQNDEFKPAPPLAQP